MPKTNLETLPAEILFNILKYLPFSSLLNVSEVSKNMNKAARDPNLWQDFDFKCTKAEGIISLLNLNMFSKLKNIHLREVDSNEGNDSNEVEENDEDHSDVGGNDDDIHFSTEEMETILRLLIDRKLPKQKLTISNLDMMMIDDNSLLVNAMNQAEEVIIGNDISISGQQMRLFLKNIFNGRVKRLSLSNVNCDGVPPKIFSNAVNKKLESLKIDRFYSYHFDDIFSNMKENTTLKQLDIRQHYWPDGEEGLDLKDLNKVSGITNIHHI